MYSAPRLLASLAGEMSTGHFFLLVALLTVFDFIQRYCRPSRRHTTLPLTECIPGENKGVKPHGLNAVYPFGVMCWCGQLVFMYLLLSHSKKVVSCRGWDLELLAECKNVGVISLWDYR